MTREECRELIKIMCETYPNFKPHDISSTINVWSEVLADKAFDDMKVALFAYIRTDASGFAPSIGQLLSKINVITDNSSNEMEAWSLVSKAIRNGYYGAEQEFNKLPDDVQKAVGSPSMLRAWSQTNMESIENVVQSNFMRAYRSVLARKNEMNKLPVNMIALMEKGKVEEIGCKD